MAGITIEEAKEKLDGMKIWGLEDGKLVTRVEFKGYREACFFANVVFSLAEKHFHHPKVVVEYGSVEIDLWSHDVDGLTERDFELAEEIEEIVGGVAWN